MRPRRRLLMEKVLVLERGLSDSEIPETHQAQAWPRVVNPAAAETIRWTDGTWGAVAKVLGGGTSINGGLYIEEEPAFFTETLGSDVDLAELYASSRSLAANLTAPLQPSTSVATWRRPSSRLAWPRRPTVPAPSCGGLRAPGWPSRPSIPRRPVAGPEGVLRSSSTSVQHSRTSRC